MPRRMLLVALSDVIASDARRWVAGASGHSCDRPPGLLLQPLSKDDPALARMSPDDEPTAELCGLRTALCTDSDPFSGVTRVGVTRDGN